MAPSLSWLYAESGLSAVHTTGRNAILIIFARSFRMISFGATQVILALFFAELGFSDSRIGLFFTMTLFGDVFLSIWLTLIADRIGRRKVLLGGSVLMVASGLVFAWFENFWVLLGAAIVGVVSTMGGDFGPFRAIEESVLSQLTTPATRADVLAWYVTIPAWGSSIGSELSGRVVEFLRDSKGWSLADSYHALFIGYAIMGFVNAAMILMLTDACEAEHSSKTYEQVPQADDDNDIELDSTSRSTSPIPKASAPTLQAPGTWLTRLGNKYQTISTPTLSIIWKLWLLLMADSVADGMVPYAFCNYFLDKNYHPSKSTLGDVTSISYMLAAISGVFAGPLARRIGLINTMVFTHVPSSAAVLFFGLPSHLWVAVLLLFIRAGLNNMDQAPRAAFLAAVVRPEERTAVMGITSTLRTLAAALGPSVTGLLAAGGRFWIAFLAAGALRLAYDFGLYALFVNVRLHEHEMPEAEAEMRGLGRERVDDDEGESGRRGGGGA